MQNSFKRQTLTLPLGSLHLIDASISLYNREAVYLPRFLFYYILQGSKVFHTGAGSWRLTAGQTLILPPQMPLTCFSEASDTSFRALSWHCEEAFLERFFSQYPVVVELLDLPPRVAFLSEQSVLQQAWRMLECLFEQVDAGVSEFIWLHQAQAVLLQLFHAHPACLTALQVCQQVLSPERARFTRLIAENLAEPLTVDAMAQQFHMSTSSFKREFKRLFGVSPARYLLLRRLELAQQYLLTRSDSVHQIAFSTGFRNSAHFVSVFKQTYGQTPNAYRRLLPTLSKFDII